MSRVLTSGGETRRMRRQLAIAFAAGAALGAAALLVLRTTIAVAWTLDPAPADVSVWVRPTLKGLLVGAILCGIGCGVGSAAVLGKLSGESGRLRLTPTLLLALLWAAAPPLAELVARACLGATWLEALTLPAAAALCGLAMVACADIYLTS